MSEQKDALIQRLFDIETDILWHASVKEEAGKLGVEPNRLDFLRNAFIKHMEARDWAGWQEQARGQYSVAELAAMLEEAIGQANAFGISQGGQSKGRSR